MFDGLVFYWIKVERNWIVVLGYVWVKIVYVKSNFRMGKYIGLVFNGWYDLLFDWRFYII